MDLAASRSLGSDRRASQINLITAAVAGSLAFCPCIGVAEGAPTSPVGLWFTENQGSIIKIAPCGEDFCGTLTWLKEPDGPDGKPKLDNLNEDAAKRGKPMVGLEILEDLSPDNDRWRGKAYNPEDGKTYEITFKVVPDKAAGDRAEIEGCIMKILCKTNVFTRAHAIPKAP